jgi:hypothetical protein
LNNSEFAPYLKVFNLFGFGRVSKVILLINIYPFEKFLFDGEQWIEWELSRGKYQKRNRSLRAFQAFLGLSYSINQSGAAAALAFGETAVPELFMEVH